jgi:hypothetical protein
MVDEAVEEMDAALAKLGEAYALYELNDDGEASGIVSFFCSEDCRSKYASDIKTAPGMNSDWIPGTVCEECNKAL